MTRRNVDRNRPQPRPYAGIASVAPFHLVPGRNFFHKLQAASWLSDSLLRMKSIYRPSSSCRLDYTMWRMIE